MDIGADIDHIFGWWHNVRVGSNAEVLRILIVSIFKASMIFNMYAMQPFLYGTISPKRTGKISYKFVHNHKWNGNKITKPHVVWVDKFSVDYCNKFNKNLIGIWGIVTCRHAQRNDCTKSTLIFNITKWSESVEMLQVILRRNTNHWPFPFKNRNCFLQRHCFNKNNTAKHRTVIYFFIYYIFNFNLAMY
jgi:hypothetical protein